MKMVKHKRDNLSYKLIYFIMNYGMGSKVLKESKKFGIKGGTVVLAKGTVNNSFLNFLSLHDERKEIVLIGTDTNTADDVIKKMYKKFKIEKPNHGIIFTIAINNVLGSSHYQESIDIGKRSKQMTKYQIIMTIVNRGMAQDVVQIANQAGARGGTIINARGSGTHETSKIFNMDIEPEKEMVMILVKEDIKDSVVDAIRIGLDLDKPGKGIIFVQDVNETYGIYEEKTKES